MEKTYQNFPYDAQTIQHELIGASTYTALNSGDRTILGVSIQQSGVASTTNVKCGTTTFVINYGKDFPYNDMMYHCNNTIVFDKTGQDNSSIILTYIDRDINVASSAVSMKYEPQTLTGISDYMHTSFVGTAIIIIMLGVLIGLNFFKR